MGLFASQRSTADRFAADVRNLVTHADELLRMTASYSGEKVTDARARLGEKVSEMRDVLDRAQSAAATQGKRAIKATNNAAKATNSYVRQHPWQALGIGLAVGAAIGLVSFWNNKR